MLLLLITGLWVLVGYFTTRLWIIVSGKSTSVVEYLMVTVVWPFFLFLICFDYAWSILWTGKMSESIRNFYEGGIPQRRRTEEELDQIDPW